MKNKLCRPIFGWALTSLILLLPLIGFAQLHGIVSDENGEPLPYASVYVRNSTNGTITNGDGEYRLPLDPGTYNVVFQYIGYQQKIENVSLTGKSLRLNVRMEPSDIEISEVVITTEDPAYPIMRKAIAKRSYFRSRTPEYSCDAYIKGFYKLVDAPKKIFGQEIGDMDGALDSNGMGVIYLSESVSKLYVQAKPLRKKEVMVSSKFSGNSKGYSMNRATLTEFNLYDEHINVDRDILSPLADNAFSYYRFRLEGRFKDQNGYDIYKIEVIPKRDEDPTFHGYVYIVNEWWNLSGVELKLTGKAIQQPILDTMLIQQEFVPVNKPDEWCLFSQITGFKFGILGFKIAGFFNGVFSNYNLKPKFEPDFFGRETFKIENNATERDSSYWESVRPVPLTTEESNDYVRKDSLEEIHQSKAYLDSADLKSNRFKLRNLLFGYTWRNSYKHTSISYPALYDGLQFNTVQGLALNLRPTFHRSEGKLRSRYWNARGAMNYGLAEKRFRPSLALSGQFESIYYTRAEISGGLEALQFDDGKQIGELTNLLYSLFEKQNFLKLYEKAYVQASLSRNVAPGLRLDFKTEYAERRALINHSDYSFYRKDRVYSYNSPLPGAMFEPETPAFQTHKALLLELSARIRFKETYSTYPDYRYYNPSNLPTLTLKYTKAIPGVGGSVVDYDFIQARLHQTDLSFGLFGYSEWNAGAGVFWRNKRVEFMDYYHPKGNQTVLAKPRNYTSRFLLLPYYEFSTADAYAYAHYRHHFNGWLLDKVPGVRKLNWKEALSLNFYYANQVALEPLPDKRTLPYWEASFGFYNIGIKFFRPLHIDVAVGFFGKDYYRTGLVLGVDM